LALGEREPRLQGLQAHLPRAEGEQQGLQAHFPRAEGEQQGLQAHLPRAEGEQQGLQTHLPRAEPSLHSVLLALARFLEPGTAMRLSHPSLGYGPVHAEAGCH